MTARAWAMRLIEFGLVQAGVQLLNAISGLIIVRTLPKPDYALFAIANSMQVTCNLLAELGVGIGLRSIGGAVWNDAKRLGSLLNSALALRYRYACVSLAICVPLAAWMLAENGAGTGLILALSAVLVGGVLPLLGVSVFITVPQLHGEFRRLQHLDLGNAVLRLTMIAGLALLRLNAVLATLAGAVNNWVQFLVLRRWAREHAAMAASPSAADRRALHRISLKSLPNTVFFCVQGSITLVILTYAGNTSGLADVTALGRISALLAIFSVTFSNVLGPRFARVADPHRLPRLYLQLVGTSVLVLGPLAFGAWVAPEPFLWLLGEQYDTLITECGWIVTAGCVSQLAGVMWNLNSSKAWINVQAALYIPTVLAAQVTTALVLDLRKFEDLLVFILVTAAAPLPLYAADAYLGLSAGHRVRDGET